MITEFKDYRDLPFSKKIQDELFNSHIHGEHADAEEIIYKEKDVLILLQLMQEELRKKYRIVFDAGLKCQSLHPDDDSYDNEHFKSVMKRITK